MSLVRTIKRSRPDFFGHRYRFPGQRLYTHSRLPWAIMCIIHVYINKHIQQALIKGINEVYGV